MVFLKTYSLNIWNLLGVCELLQITKKLYGCEFLLFLFLFYRKFEITEVYLHDTQNARILDKNIQRMEYLLRMKQISMLKPRFF